MGFMNNSKNFAHVFYFYKISDKLIGDSIFCWGIHKRCELEDNEIGLDFWQNSDEISEIVMVYVFDFMWILGVAK